MAKYSDALYPDKVNDLIGNDGQLTEEGKEIIGGGSKEFELDLTKTEEPTQEQCYTIYTEKPDRVAVINGNKRIYYYKQEDNPDSTRLYYSNISVIDSVIFCAKFEYSASDDEYVFELYSFVLTPVEN